MSLPEYFRKLDIQDYNTIKEYDGPLTEEAADKFEELFAKFLDQTFGHDIFSEELIEKIVQIQNFFPAFYNKDVGDGSWIKIKTDIGYNIYYAKKCGKKYSAEILQREYKRISSKLQALAGKDDLRSIKAREAILGRQLEIHKETQVANVVNAMPSEVQYVKALRTKSQWMYLLPYEYDIITDIQDYVEAVLDKQVKKSVKYRQLFTKQDQDQVFYMQSRGIPKDVAIMMCRLQQCYFVVDVQALFREWMVPVKEAI